MWEFIKERFKLKENTLSTKTKSKNQESRKERKHANDQDKK